MSRSVQVLIAALLLGLLLWELRTSAIPGSGLYPRVSRADSPRTYWVTLAVQLAVLILVLVSGGNWSLR